MFAVLFSDVVYSMAIVIDGQEKRLGLALSGGGFRAAAFHLGVMRQLKTLGLLDKLDVLSCVSGGSIAGGALVANWGTGDPLAKLDTYLRTKSVAVASAIGGLFDPFETRLGKLAATYDRDLFGGITLSSLRHGPRIYSTPPTSPPATCFSSLPAADSPRRSVSTSSVLSRGRPFP
jgi:NTE family protein